MLETLGYVVLTAGAPSEALQLAAECPGEIHLLITDVIMPEMSGPDLASSVQNLHPEIGLLFMSGFTANVIARSVLDEGVNFLRKPFSVMDLATKVRRALDQEV
jgi:YesN/AraC family two-component response regulator